MESGKQATHQPTLAFEALSALSSTLISSSLGFMKRPTQFYVDEIDLEGEQPSSYGQSKKSKKNGDQIEEKRLKRFRKSCPKTTQERLERTLTQRFFCIGRKRLDEVIEEFDVLGSTGNVYTVTIGYVPFCTCPDGAKGRTCKHILFAMLKILRVPEESNLFYQAALITPELESIFENAPSPIGALDHTTIVHQEIYRQRQSGQAETPKLSEGAAEGSSSGMIPKRLPSAGDACPICYEDFEEGDEASLIFCVSLGGCGNGLHLQCFQQWAKQSKPKVTCVFCRKEWSDPSSKKPKNTGRYGDNDFDEDGYLNLARQAGISRIRDTSTYYDGPSRHKTAYRSRDSL